MDNGGSLADSRRCFLLLVVLAAAPVARISGANDGRVALAVAGRTFCGIGIRCRLALHLGLWLDWTRHARTVCPAPATGRGGVLPLRAEPHVRRLRRRLDWTVDRIRTRRSGYHHGRRRGGARRASVRGSL